MKKVLLFGGTSEEHELLRALEKVRAEITLCVASEYGKTLAPRERDNLSVRVGRMDKGQMIDFIRGRGFSCVVDATHPYAAEASANSAAAAAETGVPYLRLLREKSDTRGAAVVSSVAAAADRLSRLDGPALIATGSKELAMYTKVPDFEKRLYPRVLPTIEAIEACRALGFPQNRIIAMQGPFSKKLNKALMRQFHIKTLVTKDGGALGGFPEKAEAANELGVLLIVVRRPDEQGLSKDQVISKLSELLEGKR